MTLTRPSTSPEHSSPHPEKRQDFYYPHASEDASNARELRDLGVSIKEWYAPGIDFDEVMATAKGPVLEIGGPTATGYYFLDYRPLPSRPVVGNISRTSFDDDKTTVEGVDFILDGRDLPFGDETLGIVLSAHIPKHPHFEIQGPMTKQDTDDLVHGLAIAYSKKVLADVHRTGVVDHVASEVSLRFDIAREVYDKLIPGGLYFTDGHQYEVDAFKALGFELIASFDDAELVHTTGRPDSYFYVVMRKPESIQ